MVQTTTPHEPSVIDTVEQLRHIWPGEPPPRFRHLAAPEPSRRNPLSFFAGHPLVIVTILAVVGLSTWAAAFAAPRYAERIADQHRTELLDAAARVEGSVPELRRAVAAAVDPAGDRAALVGALDRLAGIPVAELVSVVRADLPDTPPGIPRQAIEELKPLRTELNQAAGTAEEISTRLDRIVAYRLAVLDAFAIPELPTQAADTDLIDSISIDLAATLATAVEQVVSLPAEPLLANHRAETNRVLDGLDGWRTQYLAALRSGDVGEAERLLGELDSTLAALDSVLASDLLGVEAWATEHVDALAAALQSPG